MATWGGLSSLFEQPIPQNPSLIESLSPWNQIMPKKPDDATCFTEIFGELHFKEKPAPPAPPPPPANPPAAAILTYAAAKDSADKLQLCTERLCSESSDGVEDIDDGDHVVSWKTKMKRTEAESFPPSNGGGGEIGGFAGRSCSDVRGRAGSWFPPPLSSIGRGGKSSVYFKSSREDGRFVLRKVKIPTQEILHASREDGRLKLQLVHSEDDDGEEGDEEDEEPPEVEDDVDDAEQKAAACTGEDKMADLEAFDAN